MGWEIAALKDLVGGDGILADGDWVETKDQDPNGDVRLIQLADLGDGCYKNKSARFLTSSKAAELRCTFLESGDVLIARMPDPLGRACIFPGDPKRAVTAVDVCIVRPGECGADARWIVHNINSPTIRRKIELLQRGTTRQRVSRRNLESLELNVPALAEQKRIVAKVEALLEGVNAAREQLAKVPKIVKRFRQSILAAACSGKLTEDWREEHCTPADAAELLKHVRAKRRQRFDANNSTRYRNTVAPENNRQYEYPDAWVAASMDQLSCLVTSGSRGWAKYYADSGPLFIRAQNINTDALRLDGMAHVKPPNTAEGRRTRVQRSDLLITITGANVTKSALVDVVLDDAYVSQHVALVRLVDTTVAPFIHLWTVSPAHGRAKLLGDAYGAGKPGLNLDNIRKMLVGLPPRSEQAEIIRRVQALFNLADAAEQRVKAASAWADKLTQSILARAFRGELVPTEAELARREGRDYEPASVLLERIKAERAVAGKQKKTKKKRRKKDEI